MSQIKKGAVLNYATIFLTNVVGLLLTPFIIKRLGDAEYGLYTLIGAFVGYISVLDLGLNNAVIRFVAKYRAEKDRSGEATFISTTLWIYFAISAMVLITGALLYSNFSVLFENSLQPEEIEKGKIMFLILLFNLSITLPGGLFKGVCMGYEAFVFPKTVNLIRYILRSILVVTILLFGSDAIGIVLLDTSLNLVIIGIHIVYAWKKLKAPITLKKFQRSMVPSIFSYSVWIFIFVLVGQFQWKAGQAILGMVSNTTVVAVFAVGVMLGTYYGSFSSAITGLFLPRATKMTVDKATNTTLTNAMIRIGRIVLLVLLFIFGAFFLFGKEFVLLWVGEQYLDSWTIAMLIMTAYTLPLVQGFGNSILEAQNKMAFKSVTYLICFALGSLAGFFLAKAYGAIGMISGSMAGWIAAQIVMNIYYARHIKLEIPRFFKELLEGMGPVFLIVTALGLLLNLIPGHSWWHLFGKGIVFLSLYSVSMYHFALRPGEKDLIKDSVLALRKKVKMV